MAENILGTEKLSKLFISYTLPAVIAMIISGIQPMIDGIFLGNFVGENAMASVNIANPFIQIVMATSFIISIGTMSYIGRSLGEGNKEKSQNIFKTSTIYLASISIILGILGIVFAKKISILLGASSILLPYTETYVKILSFFLPFISLMFLFGFISRLLEKPKIYLIGSIIALTMNISLDYLLIKVLNFGISGAAIATGFSYLSALIVVIVPLFDREHIINLFVGKYEKNIIGTVIYNGSSEGVISLSAAVSTFIFNITFIKIAQEAGVAAFTAINYIGQFVTLLMFGISDGISPIVSYNYGNEQFDRVEKVMNMSLKIALFFGSTMFLVLFLFSKTLVLLFTSDNQTALMLAVSGAKIYATSFLFSGFGILYSGYFTAIGKAKESIIVAASRGLIFIFLGIIILPLILDIYGVWATVTFAESMTILVIILLNKKK